MSNHSVGVGGSNTGLINTGTIENLQILLPLGHDLPLASYLSDVVVGFADAASEKLVEKNKKIPPRIELKLKHNHLKRHMHLIETYRSYGYLLITTYEAVEQNSLNARFFVRSSIKENYGEIRDKMFNEAADQNLSLIDFVRKNSDAIIDGLRSQMITDFAKRSSIKSVPVEVATFAVGLLIADCVMECHVLEKP